MPVQGETQPIEAAVIPWAHLRLPPFPQVAIRVMQLINSENMSLHALGDLISSDAAFASEVLTIANSYVFATRFPASTVLQAIAVLGASHLQGMCLTVGVRSFLGKSLSQPLIRNMWHHNLACALIAEEIARAGFMDKAKAYTSGVLHDIGRLAFAIMRPNDYAALLASHHGDGESILPREKQLFGWDHCEAGRHLMGDWKLPADFEPILADHHAPRRGDGAWSLAELIKVSCKLADAAGFPAFAGCEILPFSELREALPDRERKAFHSDLEELVEGITNKVHAVESL